MPSKLKKQKRAQQEGRFQERESHKDEPQYICGFPGCGARFWKEPGKLDCCPRHRVFFSDFLFCLNKVAPPGSDKPDPQAVLANVRKSGILVVGTNAEINKVLTENPGRWA